MSFSKHCTQLRQPCPQPMRCANGCYHPRPEQPEENGPPAMPGGYFLILALSLIAAIIGTARHFWSIA